MKSISRKTSVVVVACACLVAALVAGADTVPTNILSEEDIAALRTEIPGSREGETVRFSASFDALTRLTPRDRVRHISAGTIPFRITADYVLVRMANNRPLRQRQPGLVHVYVTDADGNLVANTSMQVERMCPT